MFDKQHPFINFKFITHLWLLLFIIRIILYLQAKYISESTLTKHNLTFIQTKIRFSYFFFINYGRVINSLRFRMVQRNFPSDFFTFQPNFIKLFCFIYFFFFLISRQQISPFYSSHAPFLYNIRDNITFFLFYLFLFLQLDSRNDKGIWVRIYDALRDRQFFFP